MNTTTLIVDPTTTCEAGRGTDPSRLSQVPVLTRQAVQPETGAVLLRKNQLPTLAPVLEELEVAGWSSHRRTLAGNFHDWMLLGRGCVMTVVGQAVGLNASDPVAAALAAQATWSAVRAHAMHTRDVDELLTLTSKSLWADADQNLRVSVVVALIDTAGGHARLAIAGDCLVWRVRAAKLEQIPAAHPPLGTRADVTYHAEEVSLSLRERLLLMADNPDYRSERLLSEMAQSFSHSSAERHRRMTAHDAVNIARKSYEQLAGEDPSASASMVVTRRR